MRIHGFATMRHYERHVRAVWEHLDPEIKGEWLRGRAGTKHLVPPGDVVMVGGFYDIDPVPQRIIYVEHGAGQSYRGDEKMAGHPAYHGGPHPERVIGYISPSQHIADSWERPAFAAGCPALDQHVSRGKPRGRDTVAFTFHWDARRVCPEAWSAREHYIEMLHSLVAHCRHDDMHVIGHWHPRDIRGRNIWEHLGVEAVEDPDEVLRRASVLVADNTSLQYEAAALGIANVVLNAPWYRRDVEHGLRFWDYVPGMEIDEPEQFMNVRFDWNSNLYDRGLKKGADAARYAYALRPGDAGPRAARWVESFVADLA